MSKASKRLELVINGGQIKAIYDDALRPLFANANVTTKRASHVEPDGKMWYADLRPVGGPVLAGFFTRKAALEAELEYLRKYVVV